jgi:hypothetical protein
MDLEVELAVLQVLLKYRQQLPQQVGLVQVVDLAVKVVEEH